MKVACELHCICSTSFKIQPLGRERGGSGGGCHFRRRVFALQELSMDSLAVVAFDISGHVRAPAALSRAMKGSSMLRCLEHEAQQVPAVGQGAHQLLDHLSLQLLAAGVPGA